MSKAAIDRLRAELDQEEFELRLAVRDLGRTARDSLNPAEWVGRRPVTALCSAVLVGWWLGSR